MERNCRQKEKKKKYKPNDNICPGKHSAARNCWLLAFAHFTMCFRKFSGQRCQTCSDNSNSCKRLKVQFLCKPVQLSHNFSSEGGRCRLTHYQTTNFRLFQTKIVCRRQFQI